MTDYCHRCGKPVGDDFSIHACTPNPRIIELEREIEHMHLITRRQAEASAKLLNAKQERIMKLESLIRDAAIPMLDHCHRYWIGARENKKIGYLLQELKEQSK